MKDLEWLTSPFDCSLYQKYKLVLNWEAQRTRGKGWNYFHLYRIRRKWPKNLFCLPGVVGCRHERIATSSACRKKSLDSHWHRLRFHASGDDQLSEMKDTGVNVPGTSWHWCMGLKWSGQSYSWLWLWLSGWCFQQLHTSIWRCFFGKGSYFWKRFRQKISAGDEFFSWRTGYLPYPVLKNFCVVLFLQFLHFGLFLVERLLPGGGCEVHHSWNY